MKNQTYIFPSPKHTASAIAEDISLLILHLLRQKIFVSIALSGGKTPGIFFEDLAGVYSKSIPWERIHFFWVDERCVPPSHPDSNYGNAKLLLFDKIIIPNRNIHRINGENNPDKEAARYSEELKKTLLDHNGFPVFDIVLLGMGADGHTASIFPDQMHLLSSSKIAETAVHPESGQKRITITGATINNSTDILFFITGKDKSKVISEIFNKKKGSEKYPAAHISGNVNWYLDIDASSGL